MALLTTAEKDAALHAAAEAVLAAAPQVLAANVADVEAARAAGTDEGLLDRLRLTEDRIDGIVDELDACVRLCGEGEDEDEVEIHPVIECGWGHHELDHALVLLLQLELELECRVWNIEYGVRNIEYGIGI